MIGSLGLSMVFTALFVVVGGWALVRVAHVLTGRGPDADPVAELSHLGMAVLMIAMTWGVTGLLWLALPGVGAGWALLRLVRRTHPHRPAVVAYHLLMAVAMVWMVVGMPQIMGTDPGMPGMPGPASPAWVPFLTGTFVVLLVVAAVLWAARALRPGEQVSGRPVLPGGGVAVDRRAATDLRWVVRVDACCHLLMSLGMAGMFVAMA